MDREWSGTGKEGEGKRRREIEMEKWETKWGKEGKRNWEEAKWTRRRRGRERKGGR